jgi:hypothetical protein
MIRPSRRFVSLLCALVQLALPGALGVIDAITVRDAQHTVAHIEETTGQQCRPPHADDCFICRYLSTGAMASDAAPALSPSIVPTQPVAAAPAAPRSVWRRGFDSRAPPETVI